MSVRDKFRRWRLLGIGFGFALPFAVLAGLKNSDCLDCHADNTLTKTNAAGKEIGLFVDAANLAASAHQTNTCISCHADLTDSHPDDERATKPVDCFC